MARALASPSCPCRPRGGAHPCRDGPTLTRGGGPDRAHAAQALRRYGAQRATAPPPGRAAADRADRRRRHASPRRSPPRWAGQPDSAAPCCGEDGRRESRASSPGSGADRQHPAHISPPRFPREEYECERDLSPRRITAGEHGPRPLRCSATESEHDRRAHAGRSPVAWEAEVRLRGQTPQSHGAVRPARLLRT
jgi:hypothetical protein